VRSPKIAVTAWAVSQRVSKMKVIHSVGDESFQVFFFCPFQSDLNDIGAGSFQVLKVLKTDIEEMI